MNDSRSMIYANIKNIEQLRAERSAISWHIKTMGKKFVKPKRIPLGGLFNLLLFTLPTTIAVYRFSRTLSKLFKRKPKTRRN